MDPAIKFVLKVFVSLALTFTAYAKVGFTWDGWLIVVVAGLGGALWQSAGHDLFGCENAVQRGRK